MNEASVVAASAVTRKIRRRRDPAGLDGTTDRRHQDGHDRTQVQPAMPPNETSRLSPWSFGGADVRND